MKKFLSIISILLLAALLLTLVACGGANPPADDTSSAQDSNEPVVTDTPKVEEDDFEYKHVIIVGIDGMGAYHKGADTPNIDSIFADYALTDVAQTYKPVASAPCWLSMFTGVDPMVMRTTQNAEITNTNMMNRYYDAVKKYPTLFSMYRSKHPEADIACVARFEIMDDVFLASDEKLIIRGTEPKKWTTQEELDNALAYIETIDTSKNNFAFFYFNEPDATGHKKGYGSAEYNAMLTECDAALGEIFKALEEKGMIDDTLLILSTDHGGDGTAHGDVYTAPAINITLGFRGKTINNVKDFNMILRDVAPIVAKACGLENSAWAGVAEPPKVPEGLFKN